MKKQQMTELPLALEIMTRMPFKILPPNRVQGDEQNSLVTCARVFFYKYDLQWPRRRANRGKQRDWRATAPKVLSVGATSINTKYCALRRSPKHEPTIRHSLRTFGRRGHLSQYFHPEGHEIFGEGHPSHYFLSEGQAIQSFAVEEITTCQNKALT